MKTNLKQNRTPGRQSLFQGVERYIEQAYIKQKLPIPKIAGCTSIKSTNSSLQEDPYIEKLEGSR